MSPVIKLVVSVLPVITNLWWGVVIPIPTLPELEINIFVVGPPAELLVFNLMSSSILVVWRTKLLLTPMILESWPSLSKKNPWVDTGDGIISNLPNEPVPHVDIVPLALIAPEDVIFPNICRELEYIFAPKEAIAVEDKEPDMVAADPENIPAPKEAMAVEDREPEIVAADPENIPAPKAAIAVGDKAPEIFAAIWAELLNAPLKIPVKLFAVILPLELILPEDVICPWAEDEII